MKNNDITMLTITRRFNKFTKEYKKLKDMDIIRSKSLYLVNENKIKPKRDTSKVLDA